MTVSTITPSLTILNPEILTDLEHEVDLVVVVAPGVVREAVAEELPVQRVRVRGAPAGQHSQHWVEQLQGDQLNMALFSGTL